MSSSNNPACGPAEVENMEQRLAYLSPDHPLANYSQPSGINCQATCPTTNNSTVFVDLIVDGPTFIYNRAKQIFDFKRLTVGADVPVICRQKVFEQPALIFNFIGYVNVKIGTVEYSERLSWILSPTHFGYVIPGITSDNQHPDQPPIQTPISVSVTQSARCSPPQQISGAVTTISRNEFGAWIHDATGEELLDGALVYQDVKITVAVNFSAAYASLSGARTISVYGTYVPSVPPCLFHWPPADSVFGGGGLSTPYGLTSGAIGYTKESLEKLAQDLFDSANRTKEWLLQNGWSSACVQKPIIGQEFDDEFYLNGNPCSYYGTEPPDCKSICGAEPYTEETVLADRCYTLLPSSGSLDAICCGSIDFSKPQPAGFYIDTSPWHGDYGASPYVVYPCICEKPCGCASGLPDGRTNQVVGSGSLYLVGQPREKIFPIGCDDTVPLDKEPKAIFANIFSAPPQYGQHFISTADPMLKGPEGLKYEVTRVTADNKIIFNIYSSRRLGFSSSSTAPNSPSPLFNIHELTPAHPFHGHVRAKGFLPTHALMPANADRWFFELDKRKLLEIEIDGTSTVVRPTISSPLTGANYSCSLDSPQLGECGFKLCDANVIYNPLPSKYLREDLNFLTPYYYAEPVVYNFPADGSPPCVSPNCYPLEPVASDYCVQTSTDVEKIAPYGLHIFAELNETGADCIDLHKRKLCGTSPEQHVWGYKVFDKYVAAGIYKKYGDTVVALKKQTAREAVFFGTLTPIDGQDFNGASLKPKTIRVSGLDALPVKPTQVRLELHVRHDYPADLRIIVRAPGGRIFFDTGLAAVVEQFGGRGYTGLGKFLGTAWIAYSADNFSNLSVTPTAQSENSPPEFEWYDPVVLVFHTYFYGQHFNFDGDWSVEISNPKNNDELEFIGEYGIRLGFLTNSAPFSQLPTNYRRPFAPTNVLAEYVMFDNQLYIRLSWTPPQPTSNTPGAQLTAFQYKTMLKGAQFVVVDLPADPEVLIPYTSEYSAGVRFAVQYLDDFTSGDSGTSNELLPTQAPSTITPRDVYIGMSRQAGPFPNASPTLRVYWSPPEYSAGITAYKVDWTSTDPVTGVQQTFTAPTVAALNNLQMSNTITRSLNDVGKIWTAAVTPEGLNVVGVKAEALYSVTITNPAPVRAEIDRMRWSPKAGQPGQYDFPLLIYVRPAPAAPTIAQGEFVAYAQYSLDGGLTWYPRLNDRLTPAVPPFDSNFENIINSTIITLEKPLGWPGTQPFRVRVWAGRANDVTVNSILSVPINPHPPADGPNAYF